MSNYLNHTILEAMSTDTLEEYYQSLAIQMGNFSVYMVQVREELDRRPQVSHEQ